MSICAWFSLSLSLDIVSRQASHPALHIMMVSDGPFPLHSIGYAYNTAKRRPIPLCRILCRYFIFFHPSYNYAHLIPFSSHSWCFLLWILPLSFMSWHLTYSWTSVQFTNSFRLSMVWSSVHIEFWTLTNWECAWKCVLWYLHWDEIRKLLKS